MSSVLLASFLSLIFLHSFYICPPGSLFFVLHFYFVFNVHLSISPRPLTSVIFLLVSLQSPSPPPFPTLHRSVKCALFPFFYSLFSAVSFFSPLDVSDGSLYSAMSSVGGQAGSIRRTFGPQKLLKTENVWLLSE